ncbi:MAG TPA: imidazole glycerol phosphate synthase subunit HisF [Clostridiales bacterium]|nr:imidazole glycerol phosphate synthase subunit HisF [Clostridiales bacterium]
MTIKRIIPCMDVLAGRVVKGIQFENMKDAGDPVEIARVYVQSGADELAFLDITATTEGRGTMVDTVKKTAEQVSVPFTVGGGIRNIEDIRTILNAGAGKVSICTAAYVNPELIDQATAEFGKCIVLAIDAKSREDGSGWNVMIKGGKVNTGTDVVKWAQDAQKRGAAEILLTSVDCDGTKSGYDIPLTKKVTQNVDIPVIASGGAGTMVHFYDVLTQGGADAALAASLFHFRDIEIMALKAYLRSKGVCVQMK